MSELLESLRPVKMEVLVKRLRRLKTSVLLKRPKRLKLRRRNRLFANPYTHILCRSPSPQYANHFNPDCCVCGEEADPRKDAMIKGSIYRYCEVHCLNDFCTMVNVNNRSIWSGGSGEYNVIWNMGQKMNDDNKTDCGAEHGHEADEGEQEVTFCGCDDKTACKIHTGAM